MSQQLTTTTKQVMPTGISTVTTTVTVKTTSTLVPRSPGDNAIHLFFIGAAATGKTSFMKRLVTGDFSPTDKTFNVMSHVKCFPVNGDCRKYVFEAPTTNGVVEYHLYDLSSFSDGLPHIDGNVYAAAFYTSDKVEETDRCVEEFMRKYPDAKVFNLLNMMDKPAPNKHPVCHGGRCTYQVSALSSYNIDKPLLRAARLEMGNGDLMLLC